MNNEPIRILYVDDYRLDRELVREALEKEQPGFQVTEAASRADFEAYLATGKFDLVLSDFDIRGFTGLEVLDTVREKAPHLPVVIVTGGGSEEIAVEAMKRGAADYVLKTEECIRRLPHTIRRVLEQQRLRNERVQAEQALRESEHRFRSIVEQAQDGIAVTDEQGVVITWNRSLERITGLAAEEVVGKTIWDVQFRMAPKEQQTPDRYEELRSELLEFLRTGEAPWSGQLLERKYVRPDGTDLYVQGVVFPIQTDRGFMLSSITRDITECKRAGDALRRSLEETTRGQRLLQALSQAAQAVQRARTPQEVYRTVGNEVTKLGYHATIFTLTEDRAHLVIPYLSYEPALLRAAEKLIGLSAQDYRFPLAPGDLYQRTIAEGEIIFCEPSARFVAEALPGPVRPLAGRLMALLRLEQAIIVPLRIGGETVGLLAVSGAGLTEADVPAVTVFANQTAIAIENARLFEQVHSAQERLQALSRRLVRVQEAERRHIARELHDEVGQILTGLNLLLEVSSRAPADAVEARLKEARGLVEELIEKVDELSLDLRPAMLDDLGLLPTLLWHIERYMAQTGVQVRLEHTGLDGRFAADVETAAYRVVQEALTNVARHADVSEAVVRIWADHNRLSMQIEDLGAGFDPQAVAVDGDGSGLSGMHERVTLLGGQLMLESAPGSGTCVTAELPLQVVE